MKERKKFVKKQYVRVVRGKDIAVGRYDRYVSKAPYLPKGHVVNFVGSYKWGISDERIFPVSGLKGN